MTPQTSPDPAIAATSTTSATPSTAQQGRYAFLSVISSYSVGLVFGLGLMFAGMSNPAKVLTFLDLAGAWEPTLMVVMMAAISIASIGFAIAKKRKHSLLNFPLQLPQQHALDRRLLGGSVLFGIGWGIAGICPGPAIVLLGNGTSQAFWFVLAMALGMACFEAFNRWQQRRVLTSDACTASSK